MNYTTTCFYLQTWAESCATCSRIADLSLKLGNFLPERYSLSPKGVKFYILFYIREHAGLRHEVTNPRDPNS